MSNEAFIPRDRTPYTEVPGISVQFLDETTPQGSVFFRKRLLKLYPLFGGNTVSSEGFHHHPDSQAEVGKMIGRMLRGQNPNVLEVGPGRNNHVGRGITEVHAGAEVTLLDAQTYKENSDAEQGMNDHMRRVVGSVEELEGMFDGIVLHASFFSAEYNNTIQERFEGEAQQEQSDPLDFGDDHKERVLTKQQTFLRTLRSKLNSEGQLWVTSSRYAFHGGGYSDLDLSAEKLQFMNLITQAVSLGAQQITLVGVSAAGVRDIFEYNFGDNSPLQGDRRNEARAELELHQFGAWERKTDFTDMEIEAAVDKQETKAKQVSDQLCSGVDGLQELRYGGILTKERISEVINRARRIIPGDLDREIGRIDAVVFQFP